MDQIVNLTPEEIAGVLDHTYLNDTMPLKDQEAHIIDLVNKAHTHKAFGVCVRERWLPLSRSLTRDLDSSVKLICVIGFPCGDDYSTSQVIDALESAREKGADEFDMVAKILYLKQGKHEKFVEDLYEVSKAAQEYGLKIIFENAYLPNTLKPIAYNLARKAIEMSWKHSSQRGMRFFKTSTGFATLQEGVPTGATLEDLQLMHKVAGVTIGIKAAGGVENAKQAEAFWRAAGSPLANGVPDPMRFRIGSSQLLGKLFKK